MPVSGTEVYEAWMKGESVGSIAKRLGINKKKVMKLLNEAKRKGEHGKGN